MKSKPWDPEPLLPGSKLIKHTVRGYWIKLPKPISYKHIVIHNYSVDTTYFVQLHSFLDPVTFEPVTVVYACDAKGNIIPWSAIILTAKTPEEALTNIRIQLNGVALHA